MADGFQWCPCSSQDKKVWYPRCTHISMLQGQSDAPQVLLGAPALGDQALVGDVHVAEVQRVVDGLQLAHLDEPDPQAVGGRCQDALAVVLCLDQDLENARQKSRAMCGLANGNAQGQHLRLGDLLTLATAHS